jgi:predicted ATPase
LDFRQGMDACVSLGMHMFEPLHRALLAEAHMHAGETQLGLDVLEEGLRFVNKSGLHFWDSELLRVKGMLLAHGSPDGQYEAANCYQEALVVARRQRAKSLELRAAICLARLWCDQGRRDEARGLLEPVYGWFTEGFDRPDLQDAKALLDELR